MYKIGDKFWDINETGYMYEITEIFDTHYKLLGTPTNLCNCDDQDIICAIGKDKLEERASDDSWWIFMNEKNIKEFAEVWWNNNGKQFNAHE